jgi:hypothetical protein
MIGQGLKTLDEKAQEPFKPNAHGTTNAPQRNSLRQQAFNQRPGVISDQILLEALDELTAAVVAVMVLFAVMNVPISLIL